MLRWDDIELLRLVDALEEVEPARLWNGLSLLQKAGEGKTSQWDQEAQPFARELLLARTLATSSGSRETGPLAPTHLATLIRGCRTSERFASRSLGAIEPAAERFVRLQDGAEDDGTTDRRGHLEEIATTMAEMYRETQLPRFLVDSGVPQELVPAKVDGSKAEWVLRILEQLEGGGSANRRVFREFVGGWLDGRYAMPPPSNSKLIVAYLGQEGWHVIDGRLVIGEKTFDAAGKLTPLGRDVRLAALHVDIQAVANKYLETGHRGGRDL